MSDLEITVTGTLFLAAGAMMWIGWLLLPAKIGAFFEPGDFEAVGAKRRAWIWLYRVHLFGYVVAVMAFIALAALAVGTSGRVLIWPAVGVLSTALVLMAIAAAFYYHFGAWGSLDMAGKDDADVRAFIDSLRVSTEYVTCLTRFGRVFLGVGQIALAAGMLVPGVIWSSVVGVAGGLLGLAGMGLTMGLPDDLHLYRPVFHLNALWLVAMGGVILLTSLA